MKRKENIEGMCPYCNSDDIEIVGREIEFETIDYEYHCNKCKKAFTETMDVIYKATFYEEVTK